jgi:hypothetical protein
MTRRVRCASATICVIGAIAFPNVSHAQSFLDHFIVRQDLSTSKNVAQPGFFQLTAPEGKPVVITAGVGVIGKVVDNDLVTFGPSVEYLRNTDLAKPVDSTKVGASIEWQTRKTGTSRGFAADSPIVIARANYVRDGVKETNGFQALALYTHYFAGRRRWPLPNNEHGFGQELSLIYSPDAGLEFEDDDGSSQAAPGHAVRFVAEVSVLMYPLRKTLEQRLELAGSVSTRSDLVKTFTYEDREHVLSSAGVNFYLLKQARRSAGVGLTFTYGEDPSKGFARQHVWQFGLRVQFK